MVGAVLGGAVFTCPSRRPHLELLKQVGRGRRGPRQEAEPPYLRWGWSNISLDVDFSCPRVSLSHNSLTVGVLCLASHFWSLFSVPVAPPAS